MPEDRLFGPLSTTPEMAAAVSDEAWLRALLRFEAALARAEAKAGLIPVAVAEEIAAATSAGGFDLTGIGQRAAASGTPVVPLLEALRGRLSPAGVQSLHRGATSQDAVDTALMLVARHGLELLAADLEGLAAAAAGLARTHRATAMAGRTLLQQALPTTFGLKAAGWLVAVLEAADRLESYRRSRLAVQLGGAAGTLADLGGSALAVRQALAEDLRLAEPVLPWHTARARVGELGAALALAAGTAAKIALDVILLSQTEVAEVAEPAAPGRGVSSALPHKRNPVLSVEAVAAARGVQAQAGLLLGSLVQPHERAAGEWQAEWAAVSESFRLTGGAVARMREVLEGLEVDPERMRSNLAVTGSTGSAEALVDLALQTYQRRRHD
ncbi:MAG: 3-carboxy-cis,cis-muconate cycloisomerase [Chloroflexi bacterium]|nr:MAG: 3-carboxy-cis,cis-muconate cycloisomerase [Chloroflexota bacterium]